MGISGILFDLLHVRVFVLFIAYGSVPFCVVIKERFWPPFHPARALRGEAGKSGYRRRASQWKTT
jgi:hypothetical protein